MTSVSRSDQEQIDLSVASSARVYDFLLGGKDNFEADRAMAAALVQRAPTLPIMFRAQRALMGRIVRYLVRDAGIRQFLDIGTGIPTSPNVHEIAQGLAPEAKVVYVDNDPIVLAHARAFMIGTPAGSTVFIQADLKHPQGILEHPSLLATLTADEPVAALLIGIIHLLRDEDQPYDIVQQLVRWLPAGSYIAISTPSADFDAPLMNSLAEISERAGVPCVPRSKPQLERFFTDLDLIGPGIVPMLAWHPDTKPEDVDAVHGWVGVARKP
jgi:SAM-dependent methyltransferase